MQSLRPEMIDPISPTDVQLRLSDDHSRVSIQAADGRVLESINLDLERITALIAALAQLRAAMPGAANIPDLAPANRERFFAAPNPPWRLSLEPMTACVLLRLYHPGAGVLSFLFPRNEAEKLAASASQLLAMTPDQHGPTGEC